MSARTEAILVGLVVAILGTIVANSIGFKVLDVGPLIGGSSDRPEFAARVLLPSPHINLPPQAEMDTILALAASDYWNHADRCPIGQHLPEIHMQLILSNVGERAVTLSRILLYFDTTPVTNYYDWPLEFSERPPIFLEPGQEIRYDALFRGAGIMVGLRPTKFKLAPYPPLDSPTGGFWPLRRGLIKEIQILLVVIDAEGREYRTVILMGAGDQTYYLHSQVETKPGHFEPVKGSGGGNSFWLEKPYREFNPFFGTFDCLGV